MPPHILKYHDGFKSYPFGEKGGFLKFYSLVLRIWWVVDKKINYDLEICKL